MKQALARFKTSTFELKEVKCLTITAMLVAFSVVLGMLSFMPTPAIRISFAYFPVAVIGLLYGPVVSVCGAAAVDLINFALKPMGGFNPGITLCALITGFIYGVILYQKKIGAIRVIIAFLANAILSNLLLKSYFLAILIGTSWSAQIITRMPTQAIMFVLESILFIVMIPVWKMLKQHVTK